MAETEDGLEVLFAEHDTILEALDGLEAATRLARAGTGPDPRFAEEMLWFLREFAEGTHHAKEEGLLFPAMEANGLPAASGPTESMRKEHARCRELMARMEACAIAGSGAWERFIPPAEAYADLLRLHIAKENHCVFAVAESLLGPAEREQLARAFARMDALCDERQGETGRNRIRALLDACRALRDGGLPASHKWTPAPGNWENAQRKEEQHG